MSILCRVRWVASKTYSAPLQQKTGRDYERSSGLSLPFESTMLVLYPMLVDVLAEPLCKLSPGHSLCIMDVDIDYPSKHMQNPHC